MSKCTLAMSDVHEKRVKCNYCSFDLSYLEFMFLKGKCVFCCEPDDIVRNISFFAYIKLLWRDYRVLKGKLSMKDRGLTAIDFQACVSEVAPELHEVNSAGLRKLVGHMGAHGRC